MKKSGPSGARVYCSSCVGGALLGPRWMSRSRYSAASSASTRKDRGAGLARGLHPGDRVPRGVRRTVRFIGGRSIETSLKYADERDLIETFVERSRWHCRAARETFSSDEFRPVTTVVASTT